jgi:hypothetical protein
MDDRAPLLIVAGELDHTVPAVVGKSAAKHYRKSAAVTDEYQESSKAGPISSSVRKDGRSSPTTR